MHLELLRSPRAFQLRHITTFNAALLHRQYIVLLWPPALALYVGRSSNMPGWIENWFATNSTYNLALVRDDDGNGQVTALESGQLLSFWSAAPFVLKTPQGSSALPTYSSSACGNYETWSQSFLRSALGIASLNCASMGCLVPHRAPLVSRLGRKATLLLGTYMVSSFVLFILESLPRGNWLSLSSCQLLSSAVKHS